MSSRLGAWAPPTRPYSKHDLHSMDSEEGPMAARLNGGPCFGEEEEYHQPHYCKGGNKMVDDENCGASVVASLPSPSRARGGVTFPGWQHETAEQEEEPGFSRPGRGGGGYARQQEPAPRSGWSEGVPPQRRNARVNPRVPPPHPTVSETFGGFPGHEAPPARGFGAGPPVRYSGSSADSSDGYSSGKSLGATSAGGLRKAKPGELQDLAERLRRALKGKGTVYSLAGLARGGHRGMDTDGDHRVDFREFRAALKTLHAHFSEAEAGILFRHFDKNGDGSLDLNEFSRAVCGEMSGRRKVLVQRAFRELSGGGEVVEVRRLEQRFDHTSHPDVVSRRRTPASVAREFEEAFGGDGRRGTDLIDFASFDRHYELVSFAVEDDEKFRQALAAVWQLKNLNSY